MPIWTKLLFLCECWLLFGLLSNIWAINLILSLSVTVNSIIHTSLWLHIIHCSIIVWLLLLLLLLLSNCYLLHLKFIYNWLFYYFCSFSCFSSIHFISIYLLYMFISNVIRPNPQSSKYKSKYQSYNFPNAIAESFMYDPKPTQNINTATKHNHP